MRSRRTTPRCWIRSARGAASAMRARSRIGACGSGMRRAATNSRSTPTRSAAANSAGSSSTACWSIACGRRWRSPACTVRAPARVDALEQQEDGVRLRLDDGGRIDATLAIAADGADSTLRRLAGARGRQPRLRATRRGRLHRNAASARGHRVAAFPADRAAGGAAVHRRPQLDRLDAAGCAARRTCSRSTTRPSRRH